MKFRLEEQPGAWRKFTLTTALAVEVIGVLLWWRQLLPGRVLAGLLVGVALVTLLASVKPRWFRRFYRVGMTASFHVGQFMGQVMLTVLFFLVLTPLGWSLRLAGKDLLRLQRPKAAGSYWQPAKQDGRLDQMF
jgi:ABC-type dipeptide/oligopeptide/nickel transport system permease component